MTAWNYSKLVTFIDELNKVTNELAENLKVIRTRMEGKGVYPADAPIVMSQLQEVEEKLRRIGSNKDYPLPLV